MQAFFGRLVIGIVVQQFDVSLGPRQVVIMYYTACLGGHVQYGSCHTPCLPDVILEQKTNVVQ